MGCKGRTGTTFRRGGDGAWIPSLTPDSLVRQVHENLELLRLDAFDVVNLRAPGHERPADASLAEPFGVLAELRGQGLIRHLGLSGVSAAQLAEAQRIAPAGERRRRRARAAR